MDVRHVQVLEACVFGAAEQCRVHQIIACRSITVALDGMPVAVQYAGERCAGIGEKRQVGRDFDIVCQIVAAARVVFHGLEVVGCLDGSAVRRIGGHCRNAHRQHDCEH